MHAGLAGHFQQREMNLGAPIILGCSSAPIILPGRGDQLLQRSDRGHLAVAQALLRVAAPGAAKATSLGRALCLDGPQLRLRVSEYAHAVAQVFDGLRHANDILALVVLLAVPEVAVAERLAGRLQHLQLLRRAGASAAMRLD